MMIAKKLKALTLVVALGFVIGLSGCTPAEESDTISAMQGALSSLVQNRSLTEQFVRDVKSNTDPGDPAYVQAMESYQDARDVYNRYLDAVESGTKDRNSRSLRNASPLEVQNATADFLADATRALKPSVNTRRVAFQRAVVVPENLQSTLDKLPKKTREKLTDQFDDQVRWRSWSQL
jgi:hypothetical protein